MQPTHFLRMKKGAAFAAPFMCKGKLLSFLGQSNNQSGAAEQTDDVGQNHQVVSEVSQLPNQVSAEDSAQEDEAQGQDGVDLDAGSTEQVSHVGLTEHVPAQDGGECEEEQSDSDECCTACLTG